MVFGDCVMILLYYQSKIMKYARDAELRTDARYNNIIRVKTVRNKRTKCTIYFVTCD